MVAPLRLNNFGPIMTKRILNAAMPKGATKIVYASNSPDAQYVQPDDENVWLCDGVADEVEINAALGALSNPDVLLSTGTFTLSEPIKIQSSQTTLKGSGWGTIITLANGADCNVIEYDGTVRSYNYIGFLNINGNGTNQTSGNGIDLTGLANTMVDRFQIQHCVDDGIFADQDVANSIGAHVCNCRIAFNKNGINFDSIYNFQIHNNEYIGQNSQSGIYINQGGEGIITANCVDENTTYGINIYQVVRLAISNNYYIGDNARSGILLQETLDILVNGNILMENGSSGTNPYGIYVLSGARTRINNNDAYDNGSGDQDYGLRIASGLTDIYVENNNFANNVVDGIANPENATVCRNNLGSEGTSGDVVSIVKAIDHADLTDNTDATAYIDFADTIPAGSIIKAVKCDFTEAFNSDDTTTLTMMVGIQADLDAFNKTADPGENAFNHTTDVFWGESACQDAVVVAAAVPRVTFTEDDDGTDIISSANAQGKVTITITYMKA